MAGALEGDLFVGPKAEEHRGLLSIRYPMEHGIVTDWNDMERIWQYIYSKDQLQTFSEEVIHLCDFYYFVCRDDSVFCLTQQKICS
jgi:actin-related protein